MRCLSNKAPKKNQKTPCLSNRGRQKINPNSKPDNEKGSSFYNLQTKIYRQKIKSLIQQILPLSNSFTQEKFDAFASQQLFDRLL